MIDLLTTLRFVRGAVSNKDLVPEMKHFVVENGEARAFNGVIAISSPIDFDIDCKPKAVPLVNAIGNCEDVVSLGMTDGGRLRLQSGPFRAFIDCIEGEVPHLRPEGQEIEFDGAAFLNAIAKLTPFIGNDASRPWTNGILLRGQSAFATNNVCLVEYWLGTPMPFVVNIPMVAVRELNRVKIPPTHAQVSEGSITFHYEDGRWIRTQLYSAEWPDLTKILAQPSEQEEIPAGLFEALEKVKAFTEKSGNVYFINGAICTHEDQGLGARYEVEGLHGEGIYNVGMLSLLKGIADTVDFKLYPKPLMFRGARLRGAIVGLRK